MESESERPLGVFSFVGASIKRPKALASCLFSLLIKYKLNLVWF